MTPPWGHDVGPQFTNIIYSHCNPWNEHNLTEHNVWIDKTQTSKLFCFLQSVDKETPMSRISKSDLITSYTFTHDSSTAVSGQKYPPFSAFQIFTKYIRWKKSVLLILVNVRDLNYRYCSWQWWTVGGPTVAVILPCTHTHQFFLICSDTPTHSSSYLCHYMRLWQFWSEHGYYH